MGNFARRIASALRVNAMKTTLSVSPVEETVCHLGLTALRIASVLQDGVSRGLAVVSASQMQIVLQVYLIAIQEAVRIRACRTYNVILVLA